VKALAFALALLLPGTAAADGEDSIGRGQAERRRSIHPKAVR